MTDSSERPTYISCAQVPTGGGDRKPRLIDHDDWTWPFISRGLLYRLLQQLQQQTEPHCTHEGRQAGVSIYTTADRRKINPADANR